MSVSVTFLGTGDAFSAGGRHQAGYLFRAPAGSALLDCGSATLTAMKRDGIDATAIDAVLLSHLHGDHFAGLPYLILELTYEHPRQRPLVIAGPPGTEERVRMLFSATYKDLAARGTPFPLDFVEMLPDRPLDIGELFVEPFRVPHQETEISLGMRVTSADRTVLYSGDSGWTEDFIRHSDGVDLFICECCYFESRFSFHLDYPCIAEQRHRFGAKRTILTHLGREVLARRSEIDMELAGEGQVITL